MIGTSTLIQRLAVGVALLVSPFSATAATVRTTNFAVTARSSEVAQQVAEYAEQYRRVMAETWLGEILPAWSRPCEVEVRLGSGGAGGATSFTFDRGQVISQSMVVEGSLERVLNSVLPHEVTHTVFAARFGRPLPRWADEGGAVLSEDYQELRRHDLLVRELINSGRMIPLQRLFVLTEYPRDVMALYAEGFSVARYLVALGGPRKFLDFVYAGQQSSWDRAVTSYYGFRTVEELQNTWIQWLIAGRGTGADQPPPTLAFNDRVRITNPAGLALAQRNEQQLNGDFGGRGSVAVAAPANPVGFAQAPGNRRTGQGWLAASPEPTSPAGAVVRGQIPDEPMAPGPWGSVRATAVTPSAVPAPAEAAAPAWPGLRQQGELAPPTTYDAAAPRRLIPIAVGRTNRQHYYNDQAIDGQ